MSGPFSLPFSCVFTLTGSAAALRRVRTESLGHANVLAAQFVPLSAVGDCAVPSPALGDHIGNVIGLRAQSQMFRVHAGGRVACMQQTQSSRNLSVMQNPRIAMGADNPLSVPEPTVPALAFALQGADPEPTSVRFLGLRPKAFERRAGLGHYFLTRLSYAEYSPNHGKINVELKP